MLTKVNEDNNPIKPSNNRVGRLLHKDVVNALNARR